jgi:hypothetical protein
MLGAFHTQVYDFTVQRLRILLGQCTLLSTNFTIFACMRFLGLPFHLSALFIIALASCENPAPPRIDNLSFPLERLAGKWQDMNRDNAFYEEWSQLDESSLSGTGYVMSSADTVFIERLEIKPIDNDLYYIVGLSSNQRDETVKFKMTEATAQRIVFENPKHDFPKKITYELMPDSGMQVHLNGHEAGQYTEIHFLFVKGQ